MAATHPLIWNLICVITVWLTMVFPASTLLAWTLGHSAQLYLLPGILGSPLVLVIGRYLAQVDSTRLRTVTMQLVGAGSIFLIALLFGGLLTYIVSYEVAAIATLALGTYWMYQSVQNARTIENTSLQIKNYKIKRSRIIVHLSDVHIGSRDSNFLQRVVDQTLSHHPDIVLITGDLVDLDWVGENELAPLSRLTCPVYMCTGNHEFDIDFDKCLAAIEHNGVRVLRDEKIKIDELTVLGIDDRKRGDQISPVLSDLQPQSTEFSLLLYHRPDGWSAAREHNIDLMLAGHTHAGQIWPFNYAVKCFYTHLAGHYIERDMQLYVSSGTGTWGPIMRFLTKCEMTVIQLDPKNA